MLLKTPRYPSLYQINTRVWLTELSRNLGRPATLDDIPDIELNRMAARGFDWIWMLSVWQTGDAGRQVSRSNPDWRQEFQKTLPDLRENDIAGSGFAVTGYEVHQVLGGEAALSRLRGRLRRYGLRLMLDFVPNHMGLGHSWIEDHPEFFVQGTELDFERAPQNYIRVKSTRGELRLAHGRDPFFPGWPDTLQLNYGNPELQEAMIHELSRIAEQCDGVRCDMAMLILPDIFERTWGIRAEPFWPQAIQRVQSNKPDFCFLAEAYWDLEWTLQQQGFDYTYDKRLYDRLREGHARPVREHFCADLKYQDKSARFLENHDEPRAASTFPPETYEAAAVITFLSPGLRFFHQGQFEGRRIRISPHLCRGPEEPLDSPLVELYDRLLNVLRQRAVRDGQWQLVKCMPAWDGNWTNDCFVVFAWNGPAEEGFQDERLLVMTNYAPNRSQCYVQLPFVGLEGQQWRLTDQLGDAVYDRNGDDLLSPGLYLDEAPWQSRIFKVERLY